MIMAAPHSVWECWPVQNGFISLLFNVSSEMANVTGSWSCNSLISTQFLCIADWHSLKHGGLMQSWTSDIVAEFTQSTEAEAVRHLERYLCHILLVKAVTGSAPIQGKEKQTIPLDRGVVNICCNRIYGIENIIVTIFENMNHHDKL